MDMTTKTEMREAELDALIARRHNQRVAEEGERDEEALWAESARRYNALQAEDKLWRHLHHARAMRASHTRTFVELDRKYAAQIERFEAMLGLTNEEVA